jgi:hypothetical protein
MMAEQTSDPLGSYFSRIGQRIRRLPDDRLVPYDITGQQDRIVGFAG